MNEPWTLSPLVGVGPLRLGMSRSDVDRLSDLLGPIDEPVSQETRADGRTMIVEYRDKSSPECVFDEDALCEIIMSEFVRFDIRLDGVSMFTVAPQQAVAAMARTCGPAYWSIGRLFFPESAIQVTGFIGEIGHSGVPVFQSEETGFSTPQLIMARAGSYDHHGQDGLRLELATG